MIMIYYDYIYYEGNIIINKKVIYFVPLQPHV